MMNVTLPPDAALADLQAYNKRQMDWERRMARERLRDFKARLKTLEKLALVLPECATLDLHSEMRYRSPVVRFDRECLPLVRKAVGRLHVQSKCPIDFDATPVMLHINLKSDRFPGITFQYDRALQEGATCKVVTETSTYKSLVCDIS